MDFESKLIHSGYQGDDQTGATVVPIYQTTSFAHDTAEGISDVFNNREFGYTYSRIANPTVDALEAHLRDLECGLGAVAIASGMGATSIAIQALTSVGDEIVVGNSLFGGTYYLLQELEKNHGLTVHYVEATDIEAYKSAISEKTALVFCESIGNPKIDVPDIEAISKLAKSVNAPFIVDATSSTPYLARMKDLGVDIVLHSVTKWLGGHGTTIGGAIVDLGSYAWTKSKSKTVLALSEKMKNFAYIARCKKLRSNMGAPLSPFNAFLLELGIPTLALRMQKQCDNALAIATFLDTHEKVVAVDYPGLPTHAQHDVAKRQFDHKYGGVFTFKLKNKAACFTCINHVKLTKNLANLGDVKTLMIHPDSTIYRDLPRDEKDRAGATENLIRMSAGIESAADIIADLSQALAFV
jgi:O-acetylhomoserine (thiol)-lyase